MSVLFNMVSTYTNMIRWNGVADEHAKKIKFAGSKLFVPKAGVEGVGFYAYFKDPEGNLMELWENIKN